MAKGISKFTKLGLFKALEEIAKLRVEDKVEEEIINPPEKTTPEIGIKELPELEKSFRPTRRNKGRRPIF